MIGRQGIGGRESCKDEASGSWGFATMQEPLQHIKQVAQVLGRNRGHDMMHRSVLIIYDQQFMIATITTDHA